MIEQIMYFLLGVLLATLLALLVLPAVWHRAVRLTTRRVEAAVPVSLSEVQADKDQQRAYFAMSQRRLELQIDEMRAAYARQAHAVEEHRRTAFEAGRGLAGLTEAHDALRTYSEARDATLARLERELAETSANLAARAAELATRTADLAALTEAHTALATRAGTLAGDLRASETANSERAHLIALLEAKLREEGVLLADTRAQLDAARADLHAEHDLTARLSADLSRAETAHAAQMARHDALKQARLALEADLARERDAVEQARADLDANRAVLHAFEQRRTREFTAAEAEIRRLSETLAMLRADHALMDEALKAARAAQAGAPRPIALAAAADPPRSGDRERAVLKQALGEMAAEIVALAARRDGASSGVPGLVAANGANGTGLNGHGHAPSSGIDLAGRIRALLGEEAAGGGADDRAAQRPAPYSGAAHTEAPRTLPSPAPSAADAAAGGAAGIVAGNGATMDGALPGAAFEGASISPEPVAPPAAEAQPEAYAEAPAREAARATG